MNAIASRMYLVYFYIGAGAAAAPPAVRRMALRTLVMQEPAEQLSISPRLGYCDAGYFDLLDTTTRHGNTVTPN